MCRIGCSGEFCFPEIKTLKLLVESPEIKIGQAWLSAIRLRTLPLTLASIGMGSFLAADQSMFDLRVGLLCALTTVLLQILSNLANDYGDALHGADSVHREGPARSVQAGAISAQQMRSAIILFAFLSFGSGLWLLYISLGFNMHSFLFFLVLGLLCILAAVAYTAGRKPYGYAGLGDLSVMIFFGIVGVLGTYYMHTGSFCPLYVWPALSCGFFATAVLNVNNIRDINSDKLAGKKSIPVRIGRKKATQYHWFLLLSGIICALVFLCFKFQSPWQLLFLAVLPLIIKNGVAVQNIQNALALDPYLKQMAIAALFFVLLFGIGLLIG